MFSSKAKGILTEDEKKQIIWKALRNFEVQITGSLVQTMEALDKWGISEEEVRAEYSLYNDYCIKNDCF